MKLTLPDCLQDPGDAHAVRLLRRYYGSDGDGTGNVGALWDTFDPGRRRSQDVDRFTSDDLVSLSLLSEKVPGRAAYALLVTDAELFSGLLAEVGPDRDLGEQAEPVEADGVGSRLYEAVRELRDVGPTRASKLLARKRPRLFPIRDEVVGTVLGLGREFWEPLWRALRAQDGALDSRLGRLHAEAGLPPEVSRLRVLDVLAWSEGKDRGL
ncbi:MAG: DUF6308 family protein [Mycobacteriales bacterium]